MSWYLSWCVFQSSALFCHREMIGFWENDISQNIHKTAKKSDFERNILWTLWVYTGPKCIFINNEISLRKTAMRSIIVKRYLNKNQEFINFFYLSPLSMACFRNICFSWTRSSSNFSTCKLKKVIQFLFYEENVWDCGSISDFIRYFSIYITSTWQIKNNYLNKINTIDGLFSNIMAEYKA